jgi:hypothetical protein
LAPTGGGRGAWDRASTRGSSRGPAPTHGGRRGSLRARARRPRRDPSEQSHPDLGVTVVLRGADEAARGRFQEELAKRLGGPGPAPVLVEGSSRGAALNAGLALARQDYLAFWSDDDSPTGHLLPLLRDALDAHPWMAAAYGTLRVAVGEHLAGGWRHLRDVATLARPFDRMTMVSSEVVGLSSALFRRSHLDRLGLVFDESEDGYPEWSLLAAVAATQEMELCAAAEMLTWVHPRRQSPVPGGADAGHRRLLAAAARRDAYLPVRLRRQEVRVAMARIDELAEEVRAGEARSRQELAALQEQLDRVLGSRSWRLTRGLRRLTGSRLPR